MVVMLVVNSIYILTYSCTVYGTTQTHASTTHHPLARRNSYGCTFYTLPKGTQARGKIHKDRQSQRLDSPGQRPPTAPGARLARAGTPAGTPLALPLSPPSGPRRPWAANRRAAGSLQTQLHPPRALRRCGGQRRRTCPWRAQSPPRRRDGGPPRSAGTQRTSTCAPTRWSPHTRPC